MTSPIRHGFNADDLPDRRNWRTSELRILEEHYPTGGAVAVCALLPHRTRSAVKIYAQRRGLRMNVRRCARG